MNKWKLLLKSLPIVMIVLAIKLVITEVFQYKGMMELSEMGIILTGGVFLMGFMLAGTMADYKESEKLPSEIASSFESLEETYINSLASKPNIDKNLVKTEIMVLINSVYDWFYKKIDNSKLSENFEIFAKSLQKVEPEFQAGIYLKVLGEMQNIRKTVGRVNYISSTGFLSTGYALLETLICLIAILLMVTTFKSILAEVVIVFFVMLIYTYMYRLIKDIDNPFEYQEGKAAGAAEIDLFPLIDYKNKTEKRLLS